MKRIRIRDKNLFTVGDITKHTEDTKGKFWLRPSGRSVSFVSIVLNQRPETTLSSSEAHVSGS